MDSRVRLAAEGTRVLGGQFNIPSAGGHRREQLENAGITACHHRAPGAAKTSGDSVGGQQGRPRHASDSARMGVPEEGPSPLWRPASCLPGTPPCPLGTQTLGTAPPTLLSRAADGGGRREATSMEHAPPGSADRTPPVSPHPAPCSGPHWAGGCEVRGQTEGMDCGARGQFNLQRRCWAERASSTTAGV